jgi:solute carrier family 20 (sodium-dependent phosphate transporter)
MPNVTWPPVAGFSGSYGIGNPLTYESVASYRWAVILSGILAFAMAWGIGANDVANAFATSVGAGSITLRNACLIAAVAEFSGAVLLGSHVTETVRSKIINADIFDPARSGPPNGPELLMTAFMCSLFAAAVWLIIATYLELPVSTTHSIIGSLVGVALVYKGRSAVHWISHGNGVKKLDGVVGVVLSWVLSPVLSAIFSLALFLVVRTAVFRRKNPVKCAMLFFPVFSAVTITVITFFIVYQGSPRLDLSKRFSLGEASAVSFGGGLLAGVLSWFFVLPLSKRMIDRWEQIQLHRLEDPVAFAKAASEAPGDRVNAALARVGVNVGSIDQNFSDDVVSMLDNVEKFDPKAEKLFSWLQVCTASFDSFAHGANDVANAIAPFASIYQLYKSNGAISVVKATMFEKAGTYSGGLLDGKQFTKADKVPDHLAFCGAIGETEYFSCKLVFPNKISGIGESQLFSVYTSDGKVKEAGAAPMKCYSQCAPGGAVEYTTSLQSVEIWILALGGAGIVCGLAMWGYRIIAAIGMKLTKMTPSRGFSIEIGAFITVLVASRLGLPVSTTHCQVGSTVGVGMAEFKRNTVNWKQFAGIFVGWVFTVIFTGLLAGCIFALLTFSPHSFDNTANAIANCPGANFFAFDEATSSFRAVTCSGLSK